MRALLLLWLGLWSVLGYAAGVTVGPGCPISWTASPTAGVSEYRLYVAQAPGTYNRTTPAAKVSAPATTSSCAALGLPGDGQYYLVVTAAMPHGAESTYSPEVPFVISSAPLGRPPAPTGLQLEAVDATMGQARLSWTAVPPPEVAGYAVDYGDQSGLYGQTVTTGPETTAILSGMQANQRYYAAVRARTAAGLYGYSSSELAFALTLQTGQLDTQPPDVAITQITQGASVIKPSGEVRVKATVVILIEAQDASGIREVELLVNDQRVCIERSRPFECVWHVPTKAKVQYRLQALARDPAENVGQSTEIVVTSR